MRELFIEVLNKTNIEESIDLFIDTFTREPWNDTYESREQVSSFFERLQANNYFIGYVLMKEERVVGLSLGYKAASLTGMDYFVDQFCVSSEMQGRGYGQRFLDLIIDDLQEKQIECINLTTTKGFPSEMFYKKSGFTAIESAVLLYRKIIKIQD